MSDQEALEILANVKIEDIDAWSKAVYIAAKRLEECQWHDYIPEEFGRDYRVTFGSKLILGIRYDDGSCGTVNGFVMYKMDRGLYPVIDRSEKGYITENAVIEKWMKYPKYD